MRDDAHEITSTQIGNHHHYSDGTILPVVSGGDGSTDNGGDGAGDGASTTEGGESNGDNGGDTSGAGNGDGGSTTEGGESNSGDGGGESTEASIEVAPLPDDLQTHDEGALRELFATLETARTSGLAARNVDVTRSARERQQSIATELERRRAAEAQRTADLEAENAAPIVALPDAPVAAPVLASAAAVVAGRGTQDAGQQEPPETRPARPRVAMLAAAGTDVAQRSENELSPEQLGRRMDQAKRGQNGRVILASVSPFDEMSPDERALMPDALTLDNGATVNDRLIRESVEDWRERRRGAQPARQGAICEPFDIIRDIPSQFSAAERVAPVFPSRPAGRLGFTFTPSMVLGDMSAGTTLWTEEDQAGVVDDDPDTWKPCVDIDCPTPQTVTAEAVPGCAKYPITTEMSAPERIANGMQALSANRARTKEGRLLAKIDDLSSAYTFVADYGAVPALIEVLNTAIAQAVFNQRLDDPTYTAILDPAVARLLTIDRANRAYGVEAEVSDVIAYVLANVDGLDEIVTTLDASLDGEPGVPFIGLNPPGAAADVLPLLTGEHRIRLVEPSAAIYFETGEMNAGVQRSPDLARQNKVQYFTEEFFGLEKHGPAPWFNIDVNLCSDGARAGLLEPSRCAIS